MSETCIIVPCYNEADRLPSNDFIKYFVQQEDKNVCFVDDGSSDGTLVILEQIQRDIGDRCQVIHLKNNSGKGEAIRQGMLSNCGKAFTFLGFWDADLATPLSEIDYLLSQAIKVPSCEIIMGSRLKRMGATIERKLWRHYAGRVFSTVVSLALKLSIYDTQCGAKLFKRALIKDVFVEPFQTRWLFDVEIVWRTIKKYGRSLVCQKMIEIPLNTWIDKGSSKVSLRSYLLAPFELLMLLWRYRKI